MWYVSLCCPCPLPTPTDNPGLWDCISPKNMVPQGSGRGWTLKINVGPRTWKHMGKFNSPHIARSVRDWCLMRFDVHRLFIIWPKIEEHLDTIRQVQALSWDDFWSVDGVRQFMVMEKGKTFHAPVVGDRDFQMMKKHFTESKKIFERLLLERQGIDADTRYRSVEREEEGEESEEEGNEEEEEEGESSAEGGEDEDEEEEETPAEEQVNVNRKRGRSTPVKRGTQRSPAKRSARLSPAKRAVQKKQKK